MSAALAARHRPRLSPSDQPAQLVAMNSSTAIANARSNWGSTDNDATVLVGAAVAVVVGATVVVGAVVRGTVAAGAAVVVVAGAAISEPPPQAEAKRTSVTTDAIVLML